ncbi:hypothetical protein RRF57_009670 [Xylaria bambusicola]|uniref:Chitin biosynthesis protein CHS5 n=1 Tax=Xylaria bambusicola TaxID=326684 RepID=A0AAN7UX64_9PEZI
MLVSLTVGKVDAGVTVLLTPDKRLIEFPSILLPPNIVSGSIVDITVARNNASEAESDKKFAALQDNILASFGASEPSTPVLRCKSASQFAIVLEWDHIELATADLFSLSLYRNGQKVVSIPKPLDMHSTKMSGLDVNTNYTFHLILRTSAGTLSSNQLTVRTLKMTDLAGITLTTGILPANVRESLIAAVKRIGARILDNVSIETTHFVTTEGRGVAWEKARDMNIPVVRPEWVTACEERGQIVPVAKFYLDALRPDPPSHSTTPNKPASTPPQTQKELPTAPTSDEINETKDAMEKKAEEDSSDEDAKEESSQADNSAEEQKMRLEDKEEQKVAIHSNKQATAEEFGAEDEKQPAPSPGDGASFQDVAL